MASLIKKNNQPPIPEPDNGGSIAVVSLFLMSAVVCGIIFMITKSLFLLLLGGILLVFAFIAWIASKVSATDFASAKERYGEVGERRTGCLLEQSLPEGFTIIQNTIVKYGDGQSEIDNIVVGRTGVFIIEVKNMKGDIYGNYESRDWLQDKTDRYGIDHEKEFYSPVKQIGTHIYRLANYLRDNSIYTHISGAVYFSDPESEVYIDGEVTDIPVFTCDTTGLMIDYIMKGKADLPDGTIERIIQLLN